MARSRKHLWWDVHVVGQRVRTRSKTYEGACYKAFRKLGIQAPESNRDGGWEGVSCEVSQDQSRP